MSNLIERQPATQYLRSGLQNNNPILYKSQSPKLSKYQDTMLEASSSGHAGCWDHPLLSYEHSRIGFGLNEWQPIEDHVTLPADNSHLGIINSSSNDSKSVLEARPLSSRTKSTNTLWSDLEKQPKITKHQFGQTRPSTTTASRNGDLVQPDFGMHKLGDPFARPRLHPNFHPSQRASAIPRPTQTTNARRSPYADFEYPEISTSRFLAQPIPQMHSQMVTEGNEDWPPSPSELAAAYSQSGHLPVPPLFTRRLGASIDRAQKPIRDMTRPTSTQFGSSETIQDSQISASIQPFPANLKVIKNQTILRSPTRSSGTLNRIRNRRTGNENGHSVETSVSDVKVNTASSGSGLVEIIDLDPIDPHLAEIAPQTDISKFSPTKSMHKSGSSIDSTIRLERTLLSAIDAELRSYEDQEHRTNQTCDPTIDHVPELGHALDAIDTMHLDHFSGSTLMTAERNFPCGSESVAKRKRDDTSLSGEADSSPLAKKEKATCGDDREEEHQIEHRILSPRGD